VFKWQFIRYYLIIKFTTNMYSKYLDYTEHAIRENQIAQIENEQKDIIINQLKAEVYELKGI